MLWRQWAIATPPSPRVPAAFALGCAAAFVVVVLTLPATGGWAIEQRWQQALLAVRESAPWLVDASFVLALLGSAVVVLPLVTVASLLLLRRGRRAWAWWLMACALGGFALTRLAKVVVSRDRPPDGVYEPLDAAFPSGHTSAGIYAWVAVGVVALALLPGGGRRLGYVAIGIGLLMGPSRLVLGVHWLGDVIGGLLLASAWVLGVTAVVLARAPRVASSADSVTGWRATGPPARE